MCTILYHFFFFTKSSDAVLVYIIFCFVVFNSSVNEFHSCTKICIPKVINPCNLPLYQVVLSFFCLIVFCFVLSPRMSLFYKYVKSDISSVIRQKGESQNGGNKKTKHAKFSEKRTFLTP